MSDTELKSAIHITIDKIDDLDYLNDIHNCLSTFLNQENEASEAKENSTTTS